MGHENGGWMNSDQAAAGSVGPFPQEPAPGSPVAVAVAAETIRGFTPGPWHTCHDSCPCGYVFGDGGAVYVAKALNPNDEIHPVATSTEHLANARLIARAPDLLAEVEKLRATLATKDLELTISRTLVKSLEFSQAELRADLAAMDARTSGYLREMEEQRSALADALERVLASASPTLSEHPAMFEAWATGKSALRAAGRLP